jgi:hypothetical protein
MKMNDFMKLMLAAVIAFPSCEILDNDEDKHIMDKHQTHISLSEVSQILSSIPITQKQVREVYDAVTASSGNGYDEEYTMKNLFSAPGSGVGDKATRTAGSYDQPLSRLIEEHVKSIAGTRSSVDMSVDRMGVDGFLQALEESDIQIYWPFSERHSSDRLPIITFDPEDGSEVNVGYRLIDNGDGFRHVEEVIVDEAMAEEYPVWVVNRNSDAGYSSLEMLRREDPDWGEGGGDIIVNPKSLALKRSVAGSKTLILKDFIMKRNYDSWFAGASEFFVKVGAVEDFTASTEAELRLYSPSVTDFVIVVKRSQKGQPLPFNAVLVTDWSEQMTHCAFMITEDDGGTRTTWDCTALVRVASKSYGVEMKIPFNTRDDIVWRGQLASSWFEKNNNQTAHFGDVDLTFELMEY